MKEGGGHAADVEWVRQNGVHRILDALARDMILCRPADVLRHVISWAQAQIREAEEAAGGGDGAPRRARCTGGDGVGAPARPPAVQTQPAQHCAAPPELLSPADGGVAPPPPGACAVATGRRSPPGCSPASASHATPPSCSEIDASPATLSAGDPAAAGRHRARQSVQDAERRKASHIAEGSRSRRGTQQAGGGGTDVSRTDTEPRTPPANGDGRRRGTPPQPPEADPKAPVEEAPLAPAPTPDLPEIDPSHHQHKWDPAAPVEWRPSPQQLRERYPDPKGLLRFVSEIDAGHYGRVYECRRKDGAGDGEGERMAVKKVPIEGDWVELEVLNLRHCACEWVVRLTDVWYCEEEDMLWIAMEQLGHSLAAVADAAGDKAFSEPVIAEVCRQILCALDAIHSRQRLHLDVKPGNLLVGADGRLRLADFGTMQTIGDKCEQLGDFAFMAPEVAYSLGDYVAQSDVWSVGICCLYLADGEAPLASEKPEWLMYIHKDTCMSPRLWEPWKWSAEFTDFLSRCFLKASAERPTAAAALRHPWVVGQAEQPLCLPAPLGAAARAP